MLTNMHNFWYFSSSDNPPAVCTFSEIRADNEKGMELHNCDGTWQKLD